MAQAGETTKQQGYTQNDHSLRCQHCSIGTDNCGVNIGGLISQYIVACETPEGTIPVARIARCINVGGFRGDNSIHPSCEKIHDEYFKAMPGMVKLGLTKDKVLACCQNSRGYVFTLEELRQGGRHIGEVPSHTPKNTATAPLRPITKPWNESAEDIEIAF